MNIKLISPQAVTVIFLVNKKVRLLTIPIYFLENNFSCLGVMNIKENENNKNKISTQNKM